MQRRTMRTLVIGFGIIALLIVFKILNVYTDWLFFKEVAYEGVFLKILSTEVLAGIIVGLVSFAFILANVLPVAKTRFIAPQIVFNDQVGVSLNMDLLNRISRLTALIVSAIIGVFAGMWGSGLWYQTLVFFNSVSTGVEDPILGKDVGFYLFKLHFYEIISLYAGFMIFLALVLVVLGYGVKGCLSVSRNGVNMTPEARKHVGILGGLFLFKIAFGFYLDRFDLLYSPHGIIVGAGYVDVHARIFALGFLTVITAIAGVLFTVAFLKGSLKKSLYPVGMVIVVYIAGVMIYPGLLQSLKVAPNEIGAERPFIEHHIAFTKFGYNLTNVAVRPFDVSYRLTARDIENNSTTIKNVRLWDESPLLKTYSQLQQIRTYYKFSGIDNDRYTIDGEYGQVMLSTRELSYDDLPSKSWINEKLVFTHGNGITMGPVSRVTKDGLPEFIVKDIPPVSNADIKVTVPEIYFGELTDDYAIANTRIPEFSYPTSEGNTYASYKGKGGVPLDSVFKRMLFASSFKAPKILLSSDIKKESRILYNRNIMSRVARIAPFLAFDKDPYIVVSGEGKLYWIIDAYTMSKNLPYSKRLTNGVNYMRNSVKITIDAYDGSVNFYQSDPDDAIIRVFGAIFPGLLKPMAEMPPDLKKHIRYPRELFAIQTALYATYHMTDPKTFYNKEDLWEIPSYSKTPMVPYYLIMKLPEEKKEEYVLFMPYTPAKRDNLAAWFAARCDVPNYGQLIAYTFPRDRLVYGPRQIDARIDQDSYISQQITLWGQRGSQVIRGSLLVIPVETSLLYIQPLYLAAEDKGGLPELRRVIVAYENNVVMEDNLELCLQKLFGGKRWAPAAASLPQVKKKSVDDLIKEALMLFERMRELQRQGDWAGYGEYLKKLENALKELTKM
ncbi:MAG: UPF0182 family protein [Syntrophorhabdaceae bacterium]|nr:UPF0182 family protein [Syntrophorhabdaceae bacterium]